MRIVVVNHCHPATAHICATRAREFALALARRGHQVALLTETLPGGDPVPTPKDIAELLEAGGAPSPMLVACPPARRPMLRSVRGGYWPAGFQQALVAYQLLAHGGMFFDWRAGAAPYLRVLAERFRPEVVWATFGNTDSWAIAQNLARLSGCPWVADVKDFWAAFIPAPLRSPLAKRFSDAAALTALSRTHAEAAKPWFKRHFEVVYSGFAGSAIRREPTPAGEELALTLTGSTYAGAALAALLGALKGWGERQDPALRSRLGFAYYGNEWRAVGAALARIRLPFRAVAHGFQPVETLQAAHRAAVANLYLASPRTFHHKTTELLAARRPVVAFPADHPEALDLARRADVPFANCTTPDDVARALDAALARRDDNSPAAPGLEALTWDSQAAVLERVLRDAATRRRS
jgi:hypothetical protein